MSQMPKNVYDAQQIAYNIANVIDGLVGDAASATKMLSNIAPTNEYKSTSISKPFSFIILLLAMYVV